MGERHRVVDVHRRRDGPHGIALQHALEQVLDGAARALLRLELLIGLAPDGHDLVLRDGVALQVLIGLSVGLGKSARDGGGVFGRRLFSRLHVMGHHNADLSLGEQLPERLLRHELLHRSSFLDGRRARKTLGFACQHKRDDLLQRKSARGANIFKGLTMSALRALRAYPAAGYVL